MKYQRIVQWGIILAVLIALVGLVLAFVFYKQVVAYKDFLQGVASVVSIFGILALILALLEYSTSEKERRRVRAFEEVKMSMEFMSKFYDTPELAEIRTALRDKTPYKRPPSATPGYDSLRDDEVRVMNFFETIAIAVQAGCLDIALVDRMLGSPIGEIQSHPTMSTLLKDPKFSYEGFTEVLVPRLKEDYAREKKR